MCFYCGVANEDENDQYPPPATEPEYLPIVPEGVAPAFLEGLRTSKRATLSWAQLESDNLEHDLKSNTGSSIPEGVKERIRKLTTEIHVRRKDAEEMDGRIRQTYRQIRPSSEYGLTRLAIQKEMFQALEIQNDQSRQLESFLLRWEAQLVALERETG